MESIILVFLNYTQKLIAVFSAAIIIPLVTLLSHGIFLVDAQKFQLAFLFSVSGSTNHTVPYSSFLPACVGNKDSYTVVALDSLFGCTIPLMGRFLLVCCVDAPCHTF